MKTNDAACSVSLSTCGIASRLNHLDPVGGDPDVDLVETRLQDFLRGTHGLPVFRLVLDVEAHPDQLVLVESALIQPTTPDDDRVGAGGAEKLHQFVIGL